MSRYCSLITSRPLLLVVAVLLIASPAWPTAFSSTALGSITKQDDQGQPDPAAGAAVEGEGAGAEKSSSPPPKSMLDWLARALGMTYILVFLLLSFTLVGLILTSVIASRRERICPQELVTGFEQMLDNKQYQEAYDLAKADESFLGNVLSAGLARINSGYEKATEAMQEAGQEETMKISHLLSYLALIGTISPMVGLFGTVHGMISSFFEIAMGAGSPDPQKLADGISKALVTTLIGLAIAIPAIAAYNILRNRYERLELEVGIASDTLMSRFEQYSGKAV